MTNTIEIKTAISTKFKLYDEVLFTDTNVTGYIDTITDDSYRVRISDGYQWVRKGDLFMTHADDNKTDKKKHKLIDIRYLG